MGYGRMSQVEEEDYLYDNQEVGCGADQCPAYCNCDGQIETEDEDTAEETDDYWERPIEHREYCDGYCGGECATNDCDEHTDGCNCTDVDYWTGVDSLEATKKSRNKVVSLAAIALGLVLITGYAVRILT